MHLWEYAWSYWKIYVDHLQLNLQPSLKEIKFLSLIFEFFQVWISLPFLQEENQNLD